MSIAKKLKTVAENQQKVYDAGYAAGQSAGGDMDAAYQEGYDAGKKAEYDRFWDSLQSNGALKSYNYGFAGSLWNVEAFKPKYNIYPVNAAQMFCQSGLAIDLYEYLMGEGIVMDFSKCQTFSEFLRLSKITGIGTVDTRSANSMHYAFSDATELKIIRMLILKDTGTQPFNDASFRSCTSLESIAIKGVIGYSINFQWSPLSKASIESVLTALSTTSTGETATFKKNAVEAAFTMDEWNALVAAKSNWTVTLV